MELTKVWNELLTKGEYHLATTLSYEEAHQLAEALADKVKAVRCCGCSVDYFWKEGLEFGIYFTYDFAKFKSSMETGFAESGHHMLKLHRGFNISKLSKKELKALGWN